MGQKELGDFYCYNLKTNEWKKILSKGPSPRQGHMMVASERKKKIYLIGGAIEDIPFKEVWEFDIPTSKWQLLSFQFCNQPRTIWLCLPSVHSACILLGDNVIMVGGETLGDTDDIPPVLDDIIIFNTSKIVF